MGKFIIDNEFYCTQCASKGLPIIRQVGKEREAGHLKKIYCLTCKEETNHVECRPFTKYDYSDFYVEYKYQNFDKDGKRKQPYGILRDKLNKKGIDVSGEKEKADSHVRGSGIRKINVDTESSSWVGAILQGGIER